MPLLQLRQANLNRDDLERSVDIIAVHGLDENLTEAWTDPVTRTLWLRDLLPNTLNVARVLTFGYNADSRSFYGHRSADRIQQHAHTLVADLQADRALENCLQRPIIFICHGLGGILVKKALAYSSTRTSQHIEHLYSIFASTYAVLFFGTPHQGTDKESWLAIAHAGSPRQRAPPRFDTQLLMATEKDSETLQSITEQFAPLMKQFHIFFFWEELESGEGNRRGYIVEESSAAPLVDNTERAGIHASHCEMIRFSDRNTSSYRTVVEALVRYCRNAPSIISRRWKKAIETLARTRSDEAFELAGVAFDIHNDNQLFQYQQKRSARPRNKHFHIPQAVSSIFTGREDVSRTVEDSLFAQESTQSFSQQRRFIIHGIGGSGKSQFCSKFAQDHRERFWGVFWIDATSMETARQSFAKIGKQGGMEATLDAGKYWLSNCEEPWLLIINNADDPSLDLLSLFPEGDRGHILVTTRNPNLTVHGTNGAMELKGLKPRDASLLLLKAAVTPKPWDNAIEDVANKVAAALGYLALALVQAGAVILQGMCNLQDYLKFYDQFRTSVSERRSSGASLNADQVTIYATWEHSLSSLEQRATEAGEDAAQLLSTVAFFHFEHIRVDIFTRALENRSGSNKDVTRPSFLMRVTGGIFARLQPPLVLPRFLRQNSWEQDPHRIRLALSELRSFSLISYDGKDDSFSLHPVVHSWARDRLEAGARTVWAQVAVNVLADSILLPPGDAGEPHEEFRRDMLAHLDYCIRARSIEVLDYDAWFGGIKLPFALVVHHSWLHVFRQQVVTAAKCGYVYLERGRFNEAVALFTKAKDALIQSRGHNDSLTMAAMLALSKAYWGLGRLEESLALQTAVVDARTNILGRKNAETLSAMNELGRSYWLNGQYHKALELQTATLRLIEPALGPTHDSTLTAMDNIGVTYGSWQRYAESRDMHRRVLTVRTETLGCTHLHTLETMNNLAMALMDLGQLEKAEELMDEVYKYRKKKLGKEHPYALWALCNLAKVKSKLELLTEAENMLIGGIAAAKRSLGEDHLGVLMGEGELARVYARQGLLDKSLHLSERLIQRLEESRGSGHPDTVYALFNVALLYEMRGEIDKAVETSALAAERSEVRLTKRHPMAQAIYAQLNRLKMQNHEDDDRTIIDCVEAQNEGVVSPERSTGKGMWRCKNDTVFRHLQSYKTF
ncbi:MAG: hypothetical protein ALECFALPRED_002317 [Alectoria fallacina]|uniref:Uncharacterized protein n=1 Tax=Alectoria fallacina TaxID=1903189 RepID=A0A8H3FEV2_9LECA|nr:MAG: hypothetical protein ALECFALPRED_002317 [Alectoria fallacina]